MTCKLNLCNDGLSPCPAPTLCGIRAAQMAEMERHWNAWMAHTDFADTEPCAPPGTNGGAMLIWIFASWAVVILIGMGVWHAFS